MERSSSSLSGAAEHNPSRTEMTVTIMQISTAIRTIALAPDPTQMMSSGPRAILGRAFSTTR